MFTPSIQGSTRGLLLNKKDTIGIEKALQKAFENADAKLLNWLEMKGEEDESGATATAMLVGNNMLFISHVGDSSASRKPQELTNSHRPYGRSKVSLQELLWSLLFSTSTLFTDGSGSITNCWKLVKLVEIGEKLLRKPTSRVNLKTGLSEPIGNGETNAEALKQLWS